MCTAAEWRYGSALQRSRPTLAEVSRSGMPRFDQWLRQVRDEEQRLAAIGTSGLPPPRSQ